MSLLRHLKMMRQCAPFALALALLGCTAPAPVAHDAEAVTGPSYFAGNQGGAWEVLFSPSPELELGGDEYARRDQALAVYEPRPITEQGMWPEPFQPRLHHARRFFLPRRPEHIIYFRPEPWRDHHRPWRAWP